MSRSFNARLRKLEVNRPPGPPPPRFIWVDADDPNSRSEGVGDESEGTLFVLRWLRQDEPSPEYNSVTGL